MTRLLKTVGALLAIAVAGGLALRAALRPPSIPTPERRDWVFRGVTLAEPGRPLRRDVTLRIENGRIASIEEAGAARGARLATGDTRDEAGDLAGLVVTPGLVDMHVHYPPRIAVGNSELWSLLLLAHGVTSVREMGSIDGSIFGVRRAILAGRFPGPRIFACGAMLDGPRPSFPSNRVVENAEDARRAVADQVALGADCIKTYNMLSAEALASIRSAAAAAGLPLVGHVPHSVSFEEAGLADVQHGTGAVIVDTERVGRSDFRYEDWESVDDARIAHVAAVSLVQGIAHTPTLVNARMRPLLLDGPEREAHVARDTGLRHLPRFWRDVWSVIWGRTQRADDAAAQRHFRQRQAALAARLHAAGVRVHAGTDTLMPYVAPGSSLHGELEEMMRAGIPAEGVWQMATRDAGASLGQPALGTVAVGAPADLLFLSSDPTDDLGALRAPEAVLADGRLYRRSDLERALVRFDAHFQGVFYETVMDAFVRLASASFAPDRDARGAKPR